MVLAFLSNFAGQTNDPEAAHLRTEFHFTVDLPYESAFPLFGAWAEQKWAPDWRPQFLYPNPPADREGSVFRVSHPSHSSIWIMTKFEISTGQVQYVSLLNNAVITRIDIQVRRNGGDKTDIAVVYERTAIDSAANEHVRALAKRDAAAGPEWKAAINSYAATIKAGSAGH